MQRNETPPSIQKKAERHFPIILDENRQVRSLDLENELWNLTLQVPLPQLLYHSPDLRYQFLDLLGGHPITKKPKEDQVQNRMDMDSEGVVHSVWVDTTIIQQEAELQSIMALVDDITLEFLIDGGAVVSIISWQTIRKLNREKEVIPSSRTIRFGDGKVESPVGSITLTVVFSEDISVRHQFLVVKNHHTPLILGNDFLIHTNALADPVEKTLTFRSKEHGKPVKQPEHHVVNTHCGFGGQPMELAGMGREDDLVVPVTVTKEEESSSSIVRVQDSWDFGPGDIQLIWLGLQEEASDWKEDQVLEPSGSLFKKSLIMLPTKLTKSEPHCVIVLNTADEKITLERGDSMGRLSSANAIPAEVEYLTTLEAIMEHMTEIYAYPDIKRMPTLIQGPIFKPSKTMLSELDEEPGKVHNHVAQVNVVLNDSKNETTRSQEHDFDINPVLTVEQKDAILEVLKRHEKVFATSLRDVGTVKAKPYHLKLKPGAEAKKVTPRMVPHEANEWFKGYLMELVDLKFIEPCQGPWAAAVVLVPADIEKRSKRKRKVSAMKHPPKLRYNTKESPKAIWSLRWTETRDQEDELSEDDTLEELQKSYKAEPLRPRIVYDVEGRKSEFTSVVPSQTKAGQKDPYRLCLDYKHVNRMTEDSGYPIPNINFLFTLLANSKYFSLFDALKGYWQLELDEQSRDLTGFATTAGQYRWTRLPMGLKGAPGAWQAVMDDIFFEELFQFFLIYIDDGLTFSTTFEEHLQHLEIVLSKAERANLSLSTKKCKFGYTKMKVLGYIVDADGFKMDIEKVIRIQEWPVPKNLTDLSRWIGLVQYYRRFIPKMSDLLAPLNILKKKNVKFVWGSKQQDSFEACKKIMQTEPVLRHPDFTRSFVLYTDASEIGIGGVLSQADKEEEALIHPIYFGSKSLNSAEKNISAYEKEFLAIVYFIHFFKTYLMGHHFVVYTDHKALQYLTSFKEETSAKIARWQASLLNYDFDIIYRPGKQNENADALSRYPAEVSLGPELEDIIDDPYLPLNVIREESRSRILWGKDLGLKVDGMDEAEHDALQNYVGKWAYPEDSNEQQRRSVVFL